MRIEGIEVFNLHMNYAPGQGFRYGGGQVTGRVTTLVRVRSGGGAVGWGASYAYPDIVRIIIEKHLAPHLMGADTNDIEALWNKMYSLTRWYGRKGAAISALGALDIAFWDLRGKALGKPLYRLLGGERDRVPAYASGLFWKEDLGELEREAACHMQRGFRRMKTRLGRSREYDIAALEAIRRGIGSEGEMMVDGSHRYSLAGAEEMGKILEKQGAFWFEEPFVPEEIDSYTTLRRRISVPLAAGENDFGVQGFREMLRAGAIGIAQPDACRAGGITECARIGRMAASFRLGVATHTWSDAVALMANAHLVAALPNGITVEVDRTGNPFIDDLLVEPLRIEDGELLLPDAPGLGIEVDEKALEALSLPRDQAIPDGNYSDLIFGAEYFSAPPPYE